MPKGRLTVNLAPADIKKKGTSFDLVMRLMLRMREKAL